ncbi:hypothetical protein [Methanobrevibacter curvatus]|uniref:Class III signal peptide n=1 Tax=Methanobrevibacter curvatus TaxID=49547 RepID=A0A162FLA3_9EURY|nr:hypothetical protein [Methanobrevibacter curvatus]KZX11720.1 hypothetical protein MBCUR_13070 [Methanobrevibacter curvatus]
MKYKNKKIGKHGQISIELLLLIGVFIIISISIGIITNNENELNIAIISAFKGADEGANIDGTGIYTKTAFDNYNQNNKILTYPQTIKIIKIDKKDNGYDSNYQKRKIQLKVYAHSSNLKNNNDKDSAGDRINHYLRKSISTSFNTTHLSNSLYNPSFSNKYIFTTANVVWI